MPDFSFIILALNEEQHLPVLFNSIKELHAPIYLLDSGSTDRTLDICKEYNVEVACNSFVNHPRQWEAALKIFPVETPWIIGLDADQSVDPDLFEKLKNFKDLDYQGISGIYFSRKYIFKGRWIRYGGYHPFYQLKMFRNGIGKSDVNEMMDHRFVIDGKSVVWKKGYLIEENKKENSIGFWIEKHNRYSGLVASEEVERMQQLRVQGVSAALFGNPDERRAYLKRLWWKLPRYVRPFLYYIYRYFFRLGILDGKEGMIFHYLQAFWFRVIVDVKIEELLKETQSNAGNQTEKGI